MSYQTIIGKLLLSLDHKVKYSVSSLRINLYLCLIDVTHVREKVTGRPNFQPVMNETTSQGK